MIFIFIILLSLSIGIIIGSLIMYYKNRNLINNQKILYNELQNKKMKLNEYQKKLIDHFSYNIELLDKISENYKKLYTNITKNANFFLPNIYSQDNIYTHHIKNTNNKNNKTLPIEAPKDYLDNTKKNIQK